MPHVADLMDLTVQLGTGSAADSRYNSARYGQNAYVNPSDPWVDVTCDGLTVSTWRGGDLQPGIVWRAMAGGLTVELHDTDGTYDPTNPGSPYATDTVSRLRPYLPIRVRSGATPIITGFVDTYDPQRHGTFTSITASDHVTGLSGVDLDVTDRVISEPWRTRILWLLTQATGPRVPAAALSPSPGVTVGPQRVKDSLWRIMQDLTDTEQGMLWVDATGALRSSTRADLAAAPTPRFTFGCPHTPGTVDVIMQDLDPGNPAPLVVNDVIARRVGLDGETDSTVRRGDTASVGRFGQLTLNQAVTVPDDAALTAWAGNVLGRLAWPNDWPRVVTVEVTENTALQPWGPATVTNVLALDLGDVIVVDDTHRSRRWTMLVAGIAHDLTPTRLGSTIRLLPHPGGQAARYNADSYNHAAYGWSL